MLALLLIVWIVNVNAQVACSSCAMVNGVCNCTPLPTGGNEGISITGFCNPPQTCSPTSSGIAQCFSGSAGTTCELTPLPPTCNPVVDTASCGQTQSLCLEICVMCGDKPGPGSDTIQEECTNCQECGYEPSNLAVTEVGSTYTVTTTLPTGNGLCVVSNIQQSRLTFSSNGAQVGPTDLGYIGCYAQESILVGNVACTNGYASSNSLNQCNIACPHNKCENSGVCYPNDNGVAICGCEFQFRGQNCQYLCPLGSINGAVCSSAGNCVLPFGSNITACACNHLNVGPSCQYSCDQECSGQPCSYPGTQGASGKVTCLCPPGTSGSQCQFDCLTSCGHTSCSATACDTVLCECNGHGQLIFNPSSGAFDTCACDTGFSGSTCGFNCQLATCSNGQPSCIPTAPPTLFTCTNNVLGCITGYQLNPVNQCVILR